MNVHMYTTIIKYSQLVLTFIVFISSFSCSNESTEVLAPSIAEEIDSVLQQDVAFLWYPRVIDSVAGGYLSDFNYKWEASGPQNKLIVSQARHVWTCSKLEAMYPGQGFIQYAAHGVGRSGTVRDHLALRSTSMSSKFA